jgi:hypothetical protein
VSWRSWSWPGGLIGGCRDSKTIVPPPILPDPLPQSSPANCLENLETASNDRNFDEYVKLFAGDFTFVFSQADWTRPGSPTPKNWGGGKDPAPEGALRAVVPAPARVLNGSAPGAPLFLATPADQAVSSRVYRNRLGPIRTGRWRWWCGPGPDKLPP